MYEDFIKLAVATLMRTVIANVTLQHLGLEDAQEGKIRLALVTHDDDVSLQWSNVNENNDPGYTPNFSCHLE